MTPSRVKAVLFDIDGTLTDTNYLQVLAWRRAFVEQGHDVPCAAIHRLVGMGSTQLLTELTGGPAEDVKAAWRAHFEKLKPEIRRLPGARELLVEVHRRGARVVLASSSEQDDVDALLAAIDAPYAIDCVISAGDVEEAKPAPEVFLTARERAGSEPEDTLTVGDTVWDVEAARRCGLGCVTVTTGGIGAADLVKAGAMAVYDSAAGLLEHLDTSPIGRLLAEG